MDLQNLERFFLGRASVNEVVDDIAPEVESFRVARMKKGSTSPVYGANENFHYSVRKQDIKKLCGSYLSGDLNEWHLEYLANLIELSDCFTYENNELADTIFELSSPEINSAITPDVVSRIYESL